MTTQVRCVVDKVAVDMDGENFQRNFPVPSFTTTARGLLTSPTTGMVIYNTTTNKLNFYNGTTWEAVTSA